jgi:hypothetical protein
MIVNILKTSKPISVLTFAVLCLLFLIATFSFNFDISLSKSGYPLFDLFNVLSFQKIWMAKMLVFALSILASMGWNNLLYDKAILNKSSILPASLVLIMSVVFWYSPLWPVHFLMLFFLQKLFSIYQIDKPYSYLFDAGLILGLCFLMYPPSIFFLLTIFSANFIYSAVSWRNFVIPVLGFAIPILLCIAYCYNYTSVSDYIIHYQQALSFDLLSISIPKFAIFFVAVISLVFILSIFELINWLPMKSLKSRNSFILLFIFSICAFLGLFVSSSQAWNHLLLFALPFSALSANYFLFSQKKWWYQSVFTILFLSVAYFFIRSFFSF